MPPAPAKMKIKTTPLGGGGVQGRWGAEKKHKGKVWEGSQSHYPKDRALHTHSAPHRALCFPLGSSYGPRRRRAENF